MANQVLKLILAYDSRFSNNIKSLIPSFCVFVLAFLIYWPSLYHGWVNYDDSLLLLETTGWRGLKLENFIWAFTSTVGSNFQPLSWLSYGLDFVLFGLNPFGVHLQNIFWHATMSMLFTLIAQQMFILMTDDFKNKLQVTMAAAIFSGLLFALHPLRVESVAWASERRDVLSGTFFCASLLSYLYVRNSQQAKISLRLSVVLFTFALLAKGIAMTLPIILLTVDYYPLQRFHKFDKSFFAAVREKFPYFVSAVIIVLLGLSAQHRVRWSYAQHPLDSRILQTCYALVFYVRKTILPTGLLPMYELRPPINFFEPRFYLSLITVILVFALCLKSMNKTRAFITALLAYTIMLLPVSGFFQFGPQLVADRYSYIPGLVFALVGGYAFMRAWRKDKNVTIFCSGVILLSLSLLTLKQQTYWENTKKLWQRVLTGDPQSATAHVGLGSELAREGNISEAQRHFEYALDSNPRCILEQDELAQQLSSGKSSSNTAQLLFNVEINPVCRKARANLAVVLAQQGQLLEAEHILKAMSVIMPEDQAVRANLHRVQTLLQKR